MERPGGRGTWRQSQLPFATVRQGRRDQSPDFGAVAVAEMSEGEVVFPSDSGSSAESSQIIVPGTPSESPESPYYRHDSQAAQRQQPSSPSQPRQLTPEEIAYFRAQEQWQQERLQRQRQAVRDQRSFQAGLRSERAFYEGEFPITCTAPGPNPNEPDYSRPGQTDDRYPWQLYTGRAQQRQQDIDEQRAAIARAETAAVEQRQQIRETTQEELDRLADEARQRDRDRRQGGGGSGSRRNSAITASKRKKIKQSKSKRKSKYTRKSNKNKMQRKNRQRRN
jgi:hypothetical protein